MKTQVNIAHASTTGRPALRALRIVSLAAIAATAGAGLLLAGCGHKKEGATQVAAKVNDEEITINQVNFLLQQQHVPAGAPQAQAMQKQALDRLIDQQIVMQRAEKAKLDRDPRVMQALEASRRDTLTRFYIESIADKVAKPTDAEVKAYYDSKPESFADRKIYVVQKVDANVPAEQRAAVAEKVQGLTSATAITDYLNAQKIKFNVSSTNQPSESLGPMLDKISKLKDGQTIAVPQAFGITAITLQSSQPAAVDFDKAKEQIRAQLLQERKREAVMKEVKGIRDGAKVEYVGAFAQAASAPASGAAPTTAPASAAAPAQASAPQAGASGIDAATLQKGLGIK